MRLIQLMMGQISDGIALLYTFIEDFLFWKQPDKSMILIKEGIKLPIAIWIGLTYMPLRYFLILGLWAGTLSNSPFFVTLGTIVSNKVTLIIN